MKRTIKLSRTTLALILIVLYFSMLPLKDIIYPIEALVPISLLLAMGLLMVNRMKIYRDRSTSWVLYLWIIAGAIVLFHNNTLFSELVSGGVIQFIILCSFIYFMRFRDEWEELMYKIMLFFFSLHAIATILFALVPILYNMYIRIIYPSIINDLIKNYNMGRIAGLCSNYSTNGIYLSLGIGITFVNLLRQKSIKSILFFLLFLFALLISGKRGPLVFSIASCIICYLSFSGKKPGKFLKMLIIVMILGIVVYLAAQYIPALNNTFARFSELSTDSTGGREILFQLAIEMFSENHLFGHGWGSYKYRANVSVIGAIYGRNSDMYAHNCYLQLLAETGIIGFIIFISAFVGTLLLSFRVLKKIRTTTTNKNHGMYVLVVSIYMQVFFLMYCLTGNPLYEYTNLFPYMMSCAIPIAIQYRMVKGLKRYEDRNLNFS